MKRRISALFLALLTGTALLSGCSKSETSDKETEELKQMIADLSNEIAELRGMLTLAPGSLTGETVNLTDEEGEEIDRLIEAAEMEYLASPESGGTQVKARDWSRYTSQTAKKKLTYAEAAFYDRLDEVCRDYLNDPSHGVAEWESSITTKGAQYSDLGLDKTQAYNVMWWFKYNNPQYYFLKTGGAASGKIYIYMYDFVMQLEDQAKTTNDMFDKLDSWIAECSDDEVTAWDKIRSANQKICESVIYDPKVKAKVEGAAGGKNQSLYSVLMTPEAVCAGYAMAFGAMTNALAIDSLVVCSETHAWNATQMGDGNYYYVDVCWNDEDNGYNENFIGSGTDYAAYRDNGDTAHVYELNSSALWAPEIPRGNYQGADNTSGLSAPKLRVAGSGNNAAKIEWSAVDKAEKYEYTVSDSSGIIFQKTTEDVFAYIHIPNGVDSVAVKVRAQGTENGRTIYSAWSEISASVDSAGGSVTKPSNIDYTINDNNGLSLKWSSGTERSIAFCYGSDSTFKKVWFTGSGKNGCGWVNWVPEEETYFSLASIKENGGSESISDFVYFSYSKSGGLKLITENSAVTAEKIDAPLNFHAWTNSRKAVQCNWDAVSGVDGYEFQLSFMPDYSVISASKILAADEIAVAYIIPKDKEKVYFRIRSVKGSDDNKIFSDWATAEYTIEKSETAAPDKPAAPTGFKGEAIAEKRSKFTWNDVPGASGYNVALFRDAKHEDLWVDYSPTEASLQLHPLTEGGTYYFGIRAVKSENGVDVYSDWTYAEYKQNYTAPANSGDNGVVTKTYSNGAVYVGEWKDGKPNGQGTMTFSSGSVYVGEWKDGKQNGQGTMTYSNGDVYVGGWKDNEWHGFGKCNWIDGSTYEGESKDGKRDGHVKYVWADGSSFDGEYKDGKRNGHGKYTWASGDVYEGEYKDDKQNGHGKFTWTSGHVFEGEFKDGKFNGHGVETWKGGASFEGEYKDGKWNGHGVLKYADGGVYEGEFKDGEKNGTGTYTYVNGKTVTEVWDNGKKIS